MVIHASSHINSKTELLAVIGDPIGHSISPKMHNAAIQSKNLNYIYTAFRVESNNLRKAIEGIRALGIKGVNVTIPHKVDVIPYLDEIDPIAKKIGAINTIKNEKGILKAKNTDAEGSIKALHDAGFSTKNKNAVILGAGGAARAIAFQLASDLSELVLLNRSPERPQELATNIQTYFDVSINIGDLSNESLKYHLNSADLVINTTPYGMYPSIQHSIIPKELLRPDIFVYDVIYNPMYTQLLQDAKQAGCEILTGVDMFVNQGAVAFEWWTGVKPDTSIMKDVVIKELRL